MTDPLTKAHAAVDYMYSEHRRQIREKNQKINALQAEKGELQRALQERPEAPSEALIERAEKAERERDEALTKLARHEDRETALRIEESWDRHAAESRSLTPDAITDEMVERARDAIAERSGGDFTPGKVRTYNILRAALTEPPARPEGAEEWEDWLIEEALPHESMPDEDIARLADQIAAHLTDPTHKEA